MRTLDYRLQVSRYDGTWAYELGSGTIPDKTTAVVLGDPFSYAWSFVDEQIPGHLAPATAAVTFGALSAAVLPAVEVGDLVALHLVAISPGHDDTTLVRTTMRVSGVEVEINPGRMRPAVLTVALVDPLVDLAGPVLAYGGNPRLNGRERFALIGSLIGRSIGCATGLSDFAFGGALAYLLPNATAADVLTSLCNSSAGDTLITNGTHCLTSYVGAWPSGFGYIGPGTWHDGPAIGDPASDVKYLLTPTKRALADTATLSAAYCVTPARARKGREHIIDAVAVEGYEQATAASGADPLEYRDLTYTVYGPPSPSVRTRNIKTQNVLGIYDRASGDPNVRPLDAVIPLGQAFLSDDTARAQQWTFDDFVILSDRLTPEMAADVLPTLVANPPGYGTPGIVRHLTITDLPPSIRLTGTSALSGFLTKGSVSISGGRLRHQVTTTPGNP